MSPQAGRPKSNNPKDVRFSVRLDQSTFAQLQDYCTKASINVATAIRAAIEEFLDKRK